MTVPDSRRYGHRHRAIRARLERQMQREGGECAETVCLEPSRYIAPGEPWHLAHDNPDDHRAYRGPAHVRCNIAERNRRVNRQRAGSAQTWHSAGW